MTAPTPGELLGQTEDRLVDAEKAIDSYRDEVARILAERDRLADGLYFERKQVIALRDVLGEIFNCLAAGDAALLDDEQIAEWRERAGMDEP